MVSLNIDDYSTSSAFEENFQNGEFYNAIIGAITPASNTWKDVTKHGFVLSILVEDGEGKPVWKASQFVSLSGNIFFERAAFAQLMQSLLKTGSKDEQLKKEIKDAGLSDISAIVGRPCVVSMKSRTTAQGATFWSISEVRGCTNIMKGLRTFSGAAPLNITRVISKFTTIEDGTVYADGVNHVDVVKDEEEVPF